MRENSDQNNSEYEHVLRSESYIIDVWQGPKYTFDWSAYISPKSNKYTETKSVFACVGLPFIVSLT